MWCMGQHPRARLQQSRRRHCLCLPPTPSQTSRPSGRSTGYVTRPSGLLTWQNWIHPSQKLTFLTCSHTQVEQGCMWGTQVITCPYPLLCILFPPVSCTTSRPGPVDVTNEPFAVVCASWCLQPGAPKGCRQADLHAHNKFVSANVQSVLKAMVSCSWIHSYRHLGPLEKDAGKAHHVLI